ncbi:MAG: hypothetical protein GSR73_06695, partial [Desulfurococcales archaeon]|nr:hypothetical protein [Desulfurococcales archaeon]
MTRWKLACTECGRTWELPVSFRLDKMGRIYHFCPYCKRNTFHIVLGKVPNGTADTVEAEEALYLGDELAEG